MHHRAGRLGEAERHYKAILRIEPRHPDAHHNLGVIAMQTKRPADALYHLEAALESSPNQGQYWLSYIDALVQAGQTDRARRLLEQVRERGLKGKAVDELSERLERPSPEEINRIASLFDDRRYVEAEVLARGLVERFPRHGVGWKALAVALHRQGKIQEALEPAIKAAEMMPQDAEAIINMGNTLQVAGRFKEAEACFRRALEIRPDYTDIYVNLGVVLRSQGRLADAEAAYRRMLMIKEDFAEVHNNLGVVLQEQGRYEEAEAACRRALALRPDYAEAYNNLGVTFQEQGRLMEAEENCRRALTLKPDMAEACNNLSNTLREQGRYEEAETLSRRALALKPGYAEAYSNLGNALQEQGRLAEAEACYQQALIIRPDYAEAYSNLGNTLQEQGRLKDAEACYRRAIEIKPDYADACNNLGGILQEQRRLDDAEACYRGAVHLKQNYAEAHSNLAVVLQYTDRHTSSARLEQARYYGRLMSGKAARVYSSWPCDSRPQRLRVGLVSGDIRNHPVGFFLEAFVPYIDAARVELIAYPTIRREDDLTERLKPFFTAWKTLAGQMDEAAVRMIHDDGIHILLDLAGHSRYNRLPLFAWKPAPVQASWLGYFATTGVEAMDYLIGDPYVTPVGEEGHFTESVWRLPYSYTCFSPPNDDVKVGPLPALSAGCVTFGCFNNLGKMNDAVVALWSRVLTAVPDSRLFLKTRQLGDPAVSDDVRNLFSGNGVDRNRLILEGESPRAELLSAYNRVDIALDPFPYPGGVTSIEALWMGVPVITRRGDRFLSHVGEGIAHNAGMADWIAADDDDYVSKAISRAGELEKLAEVRSGLRDRVMASPLFDSAGFALHVEEALWGMWNGCHKYCSTPKDST